MVFEALPAVPRQVVQAAFAAVDPSTFTSPVYLGECRWPLRIISPHRELDLTSCFEHAVLLPVPLLFTLVLATAQIFRTRRRLIREEVQWVNRGKLGEKFGFVKLVSRVLVY